MSRSSNMQMIAVALVVTLLCHSASGQSRSHMLQTSGYEPDGVLEPWKTSEVACVEPGLLESIQVKLGDQVRVGDPLATIESSILQVQLAIAQAQAASVGRQLSARAEVELHERRVKALEEARENRYSSQSELERAQADLNISRGHLAAELEEQQVLQLQVARLKQQLKQRTVVAPINGLVVELHKELGEYVSPTNPEIMQIADVSRLRASFFLQVNEVLSLARDGKVRVRLNDGQQTIATVEHVSPVADGESGLIEVRVLIDNASMKVLGSRCTLLLSEDGKGVRHQ